MGEKMKRFFVLCEEKRKIQKKHYQIQYLILPPPFGNNFLFSLFSKTKEEKMRQVQLPPPAFTATLGSLSPSSSRSSSSSSSSSSSFSPFEVWQNWDRDIDSVRKTTTTTTTPM